MHGQAETSWVPRWTWVILHLAQVLAALWILFGGGYAAIGHWFGRDLVPGDPVRRAVLGVFAVVLWARMSLTALYLLKRRFGWSEAVPVIFASAIYQLVFAWLGAGTASPFGVLGWLGVVLYATGSVFNTGSELQRKAFKAKPEHEGKLYTGGFFALCRHPNYFGDSLWGLGWALVTASWWSAIVVAIEVGGFVFSQVPMLDAYLEQHYGDAYREWARHTKRFVPFVY